MISIWFLGAVSWAFRRRTGLGPALMLSAGLLLFILAWPPVSWFLLNSLESRYGGYTQPAELKQGGVKTIVVLSAGFTAGVKSPWDKLNAPSLKRTMEGVRLWKALPGASLVIMGGDYYSGEDNAAEAMGKVALALGVPRKAIRLETASWDTEDQAASMVKELKNKPFALVTSASHMPRSVRLFHNKGLKPIPAPADFHTLDWQFTHASLMPCVNGLVKSQRAIYEYLGLVYIWFRGLSFELPV